MRTIRSITLLILLISLCQGVESRTWLPGSKPWSFALKRKSPKMQQLSALPGVPFLRTPPSDKFYRGPKFAREISNISVLGARGGHASEYEPIDDDVEDIEDTKVATITSTTVITEPLPAPTPPSEFILPGGAISPVPMSSNDTATTAKTDMKEDVTSVKAAAKEAKLEAKQEAKEAKIEAKQEKKELKKKQKEEKKRHKQIANKLRNRNAMNKRRKFMHAAYGLLFASMNHFIPRKFFLPGMTILTSATMLMELLRYREGFEWMNETLHKVLGHALRKHEMDGRFTGSFYYFLGVTVTSALYPKSCATLGICQLAIADPMASYFGKATRHVYWSRIGNGFFGLGRNKGILGFLGGAVACVPLNYRLLSIAKFPDPSLVKSSTVLLASLALGAAGALADLMVPTPALTLPKKIYGVSVPPLHVDDNCIVPILSGLACEQIFRMCHWPIGLQLATHLFVR